MFSVYINVSSDKLSVFFAVFLSNFGLKEALTPVELFRNQQKKTGVHCGQLPSENVCECEVENKRVRSDSLRCINKGLLPPLTCTSMADWHEAERQIDAEFLSIVSHRRV